ncbi:MAG: DegT/DnrJ/EryC1/StrS family aminotransferase [Proteobacteria bacterium]|nr:DegT/DnrJ/EryC1/StrS family aminotransferase [Pseudomonadota bacterium]
MSTEVNVPLLDLKLQYLEIKDEIALAIERVVESQAFILGPEVDKFEEQIGKYCHAKYAIGVSSGTDALLLSLMALEIKSGDEVITSPYTFFATAGSITRAGAKPVFVDIDPVSYNLDVNKLEAAITPRTKAIMPVHLYGQCSEMDEINAIAKKYNLAVVEDAAQAIGAKYKGKIAGELGTVGCFSFFPSKNLGCFGDAGLVTTNDEKLAYQLKILRVHGGEKRYYHEKVGGNFRIDALQAAIIAVKLPLLDSWAEKRRKNAALYKKLFSDYGLCFSGVNDVKISDESPVFLPRELKEHYHVYNQYIIRVENRDGLQQFLNENHIGNAIYYPLPLHLQKCFSHLEYGEGSFPESELAAKQTLALPIFPELKEDQIVRVVEAIKKFYKK